MEPDIEKSAALREKGNALYKSGNLQRGRSSSLLLASLRVHLSFRRNFGTLIYGLPYFPGRPSADV